MTDGASHPLAAGGEPPGRVDSVDDLRDDGDAPAIASVSDLHGHLAPTRSALLAVGDHPDHPPLVTADDDGLLHWAGGEGYVLVVNGDLIDRGPDDEACLELVARLQREAPPGHVRYLLGNHEMGALFADLFPWDDWYSGQCAPPDRAAFYDAALDGRLAAAFGGYGHTYVHAGGPDCDDPAALNDQLEAAARRLADAVDTVDDHATQEAVMMHHDLFAVGQDTGREPPAGPLWLDFEHLPADAPPQVVGHTRHDVPTRKGNAVCGNVVRNALGDDGGEAALVETPEELVALVRTADGGVDRRPLD